MNKQELVRQIAADAEVTQRQATVMLDSMINIIINAVAQGDKIQLSGFGSFEGRKREARTARNPQTQELIEVPATTVPVFRAGREFKEAVRD